MFMFVVCLSNVWGLGAKGSDIRDSFIVFCFVSFGFEKGISIHFGNGCHDRGYFFA